MVQIMPYCYKLDIMQGYTRKVRIQPDISKARL